MLEKDLVYELFKDKDNIWCVFLEKLNSLNTLHGCGRISLTADSLGVAREASSRKALVWHFRHRRVGIVVDQ